VLRIFFNDHNIRNKEQKKNFLSKIFFFGSLKKIIIGIKKEKIKNILFKKIYIVINR
jgi:hypothetical protein